ncbi:MAG: phenylalanine--tRNA ligase subunit beta [Prevotellaceae bacterium]|jgi:phenylalanyl-tRNA synthetase beta chain|nr:phenylalanine--tRNA ligase subunit beta [Prevotellaceae bacterium]
MKISYNWLKNYLTQCGTPEVVANILTSTGLEVESVERIESVKGGLNGVVVGEVLSCEKHPDADKLKVTTVDIGADKPLQIVCGAPNVSKGQKVAVATTGTTLYFSSGDEVKIKKSKIRGVESFGMICAEDELGIGNSHEGIMVLDGEAIPGVSLKEILQLEDDYVFEIGLTPNRIDAASHYGTARDLSAFFRTKAVLPDVSAFMIDNYENPFEVSVEDTDRCFRYSGITVSNLKVKPSPEWLQKCLKAIGIKPKNNVVDVTNFVLHELGQPLHAFDADKVDGRKINVRVCDEGCEFKTLDGEIRKLKSSDLMICDQSKPMCIAGVFGGLDSGVTDETTSVFIESACFNPESIRKTSRFHGLFTDSSFRFERGTDPNMTVYALKRAALLIKELGEGEISSDIIDIYPQVIEPAEIKLSYNNIYRIIGKNIPADEIQSIVEALEMKIIDRNEDGFTVLSPTYRVDVQREIDVIEDILRIYGYNSIEIPNIVHSTLSYVRKPDKDKLINSISDFLTANGFREIMSNSLTKSGYYESLETYKPENCVKILNPLSNELNVMRQTLLFGGLEAIAGNINHKKSDLKFYETGNVYEYRETQSPDRLNNYREETKIALFITGNENSPSWNKKAELSNFFTLKTHVEKILLRFGVAVHNLSIGDVPKDIFADGMSLSVPKGKPVLNMGIVSKNLRKNLDVNQDVFFAEISFPALMNFVRQNKTNFRELARFPEVRRDLALVIDKNVSFSVLRDIAFRTERKLLKGVGLFDIYEGDKLAPDKKQYALSFTIRDEEKTLTDSSVEQIMNNLLKAFEKETGAVLR